MADTTRGELQSAILRRFRAVHPWAGLRQDWPGYLILPGQNLLPSLADERVLADFRDGDADGGELVGDPPKFAAVHSSSALTANAFGPFRFHPERLRLVGIGDFVEARFEMKLSTGLPGVPPHLDFFAEGPEGIVAVESKFTEVLGSRTARFAESYHGAVERLAESEWIRMYRSLLDRPGRFRHLDAAQLVKQYLGMRYSLSTASAPQILLYLYWEPKGADLSSPFLRHRREVEEFAGHVSGSAVRFESMSYDELWAEWSAVGEWEGMEAHVGALRARYGVGLRV